MAERYQPAAIEAKWQAYWEEQQSFKTPDSLTEGQKTAYILDMFPYPSGAGLHVGHPEGYTATDIVARYMRAKGYAVLHPMGWDAFGLPAEQHAIRTGAHPRSTTEANIATFRRQLKSLGFSYDWSREVDTTDPDYFRWTQWIFLKLFERGLAYQAEIPVNWCAALGTVLANEEVKDGLSEIGGHPVERLPLRQWMLRITAYADRLLDDLDKADWPKSTQAMQREWIGRSEGAELRFAVEGYPETQIEVFTTRPDTLFGVTFLVLAPEHPEVDALCARSQRQVVEAYRNEAQSKSDLERKSGRDKSGVPLGAFALHPLSGERIPIWIADYVLASYGTGAVMAVPAHDERDFDFAKAHALPIRHVIVPAGESAASAARDRAFSELGQVVDSGPYSGLSSEECKEHILRDLEAKGQGRRRIEYKLRDWVFSRQRYWGEPIPIYFPVETEGDPRRGDAYRIRYDRPIPLREDELPLLLPEIDDFRPGDDPAGPLARAVDWRFFEREGRWYARETNTMPQWAGSCWYYLRFTDPRNGLEAWSKEATRWLPVSLYVGGAEHAVLHLLYARFWHKVLYDEGLVPCEEPFQKLVHQGMILGEVEYSAAVDAQGLPLASSEVEATTKGWIDRRTGEPVKSKRFDESEVIKNEKGEFVLRDHPEVLVDARAHKMSKSRGNVVNPDEIVAQFGADAMRVYEMFMGPLEATKPWSTRSIHGIKRFLDRAYEVVSRAQEGLPLEGELLRTMHQTIRKVSEDIEALRFNTAVSCLMVFVNDLMKQERTPKAAAEALTLLLHPFAPHLAEELWQQLGGSESVQRAAWPSYDPALCEESEVEVPVQINGKVRARVRLPKDASQEVALKAASADPALAALLKGKTLRKTIWVPGKILNLIC